VRGKTYIQMHVSFSPQGRKARGEPLFQPVVISSLQSRQAIVVRRVIFCTATPRQPSMSRGTLLDPGPEEPYTVGIEGLDRDPRRAIWVFGMLF
jgi:hypothetical protein